MKRPLDLVAPQIRNGLALEVLEQATEYVRLNPDVDALVVMACCPRHCMPFSTPIGDPLSFIGLLELMKHDLFREK